MTGTATNGGTHRGTRAIQRLVEFAPSTGGLALWMAHTNDNAADAPVIRTDGRTIIYGPAFEHRSLTEQTGLVAHNVLHVALRHPQRFLDLNAVTADCDLALFNACADAIVNSTLEHVSWLTLPSGSIYLDTLLARVLAVSEPVEKSLLAWDVERLYRAIDDRHMQTMTSQTGRASDIDSTSQTTVERTAQGRAKHDGPRAALVRNFAAETLADLAPDPAHRDTPEQQADDVRTWSERLIRGHTSDGAFSMLRTLIADVPRTNTPWEQILRAHLARHLSQHREPSWSRASRSYIANQGRISETRRMPWEPGHTAAKAKPRLAVIVDVSGSIDDAILQRFTREIDAITRRQDAAITVIVGDDRVASVTHVAPGKFAGQPISCEGGGGTDFTPLLAEAANHAPDVAIVLTDLDGPARFRPRFPVIWAIPQDNAAAIAPFGRKLILR